MMRSVSFLLVGLASLAGFSQLPVVAPQARPAVIVTFDVSNVTKEGNFRAASAAAKDYC